MSGYDGTLFTSHDLNGHVLTACLAPFHLCEESSNANIAAPRAIVMTSVSGLIGGWAIVLVIAYTVKDVMAVVAGDYGQPFGSLCLQVLGQRAGLAMFSLNIIAQFFVGQGCTITATRVVFAFARDGALPGSRWWSHVDRRTRTPVIATWGISILSALLGLLMFASPVAIGAVFSLGKLRIPSSFRYEMYMLTAIGAIAQYTSFTAPVALKLFSGDRFQPGPWNLGHWSKPVNMCACVWWLIILPALCFPAVKGADLTPLTMNWTCLIYGAPMLLATLWFAFDARKWFKGPRVNVSVVHGVDESAIQQLAYK